MSCDLVAGLFGDEALLLSDAKKMSDDLRNLFASDPASPSVAGPPDADQSLDWVLESAEIQTAARSASLNQDAWPAAPPVPAASSPSLASESGAPAAALVADAAPAALAASSLGTSPALSCSATSWSVVPSPSLATPKVPERGFAPPHSLTAGTQATQAAAAAAAATAALASAATTTTTAAATAHAARRVGDDVAEPWGGLTKLTGKLASLSHLMSTRTDPYQAVQHGPAALADARQMLREAWLFLDMAEYRLNLLMSVGQPPAVSPPPPTPPQVSMPGSGAYPGSGYLPPYATYPPPPPSYAGGNVAVRPVLPQRSHSRVSVPSYSPAAAAAAVIAASSMPVKSERQQAARATSPHERPRPPPLKVDVAANAPAAGSVQASPASASGRLPSSSGGSASSSPRPSVISDLSSPNVAQLSSVLPAATLNKLKKLTMQRPRRKPTPSYGAGTGFVSSRMKNKTPKNAAAAATDETPSPQASGDAVQAASTTSRSSEYKCQSCNATNTPEWRRGPDGPRTLCNACGLHYAKLLKRQRIPDEVKRNLSA